MVTPNNNPRQLTIWEEPPASQQRSEPITGPDLRALKNVCGDALRANVRGRRTASMADPIKLVVLLTSCEPSTKCSAAERITVQAVDRLIREKNGQHAKRGGQSVAVHRELVPHGVKIAALMNRAGVTDISNVIAVGSDKWGINEAALTELIRLGGKAILFLNDRNLEHHYCSGSINKREHPCGRSGFGDAIRTVAAAFRRQ